MPSYTSTTTLKRVQYDPAPDGSVVATSFFEVTLINDDDPDDVSIKPWESVNHVIPPELAEQIEEIATAARDAQLSTKTAEKAARVAAARAKAG